MMRVLAVFLSQVKLSGIGQLKIKQGIFMVNQLKVEFCTKKNFSKCLMRLVGKHAEIKK